MKSKALYLLVASVLLFISLKLFGSMPVVALIGFVLSAVAILALSQMIYLDFKAPKEEVQEPEEEQIEEKKEEGS